MVWQPLWLSLRVASTATLIALVIGVALARLLARRRHPLLQALDALTALPMVMPPTVFITCWCCWDSEVPWGVG